jgi:fatty acid desaturase
VERVRRDFWRVNKARPAEVQTFNARGRGFSRSEKLDVAAAALTAAIAINRRCVSFALAVGAAKFAAFVGRAVTGGMSTFFHLVGHFFSSPSNIVTG